MSEGQGQASATPKRPIKLVRHEGFPSRFLPNTRDVLVLLPDGYHTDTSRRYPVLYMQDGQNLFDPATSFIPGQYWRFESTTKRLIKNGEIEPLIVVGIQNTGHYRIEEYTPTSDWHLRKGGKAVEYGRLLVSELKPFIDHTYRTLPEAKNTGLGGSSLGGLVSLYLGLLHSSVFGKLAVYSPSLWWDARFMTRFAKSLPRKTDQKIWLDIGTKEGRGFTGLTRELRDVLVEKGWTVGADLHYLEARNARHTEAAWARRVAPMLRFLYGASAG